MASQRTGEKEIRKHTWAQTVMGAYTISLTNQRDKIKELTKNAYYNKKNLRKLRHKIATYMIRNKIIDRWRNTDFQQYGRLDTLILLDVTFES